MMSGSNPFRRSNVPKGNEIAIPGHPNDRQSAGNALIGLPSLKVEVPLSTGTNFITKRVRIASPPVPISPETPASYASSPEVTRSANFLASPPPLGSEHVPYARVLASNPFQASLSDGEQEEVDEELLENTRRNAAPGITVEDGGVDSKPDLVKATLARFTAVPRRMTAPPTSGAGEHGRADESSRPALDVDAFKRLLLTGDSGVPTDQAKISSRPAVSQPAFPSDSSSSNTDTASVSQQSMFEPLVTAISDTPRTSHELDIIDVLDEQGQLTARGTANSPKKPPVPRPRRGKPLSGSYTGSSSLVLPSPRQTAQRAVSPALDDPTVHSPSDHNKPLPPLPPDNTRFPTDLPCSTPVLQPSASIKRPPTPPLTRRRSQRRSQPMQDSQTVSPPLSVAAPTLNPADQDAPDTPAKAPLPPPSRRQKRFSEIGLQSAESTVQEEPEPGITASLPHPFPSASTTSSSMSKPQLPPSRNPSLTKRLSRGSSGSSTAAPPLPPPRRVRGSSRSSFDSQSVAIAPDQASFSDASRPSNDSSRNVSGQSTSDDILADLAALQGEVDALRKRQSHEAGHTQ